MRIENHRKRSERGAALISALAVVAMSTLLMSGVCLLSTSHADRQKREADYALAMQLAEAGLNYEINYYSNQNTVHLSSGPYSGSVTGVSGSFSVYSNSANPTIVTSTGTVGGISRTVSINVSGSSIFDGNYAVFGTTGVTLNQNSITGAVGSNSTVAGSAATGSNCHLSNNCSDNYDTVDNICARTFTNGWNDIGSDTFVNKQCSHMRCLISQWYPYWNMTTTCNWSATGNKRTCTDSQVNQLPSGILVLTPGDTNTDSTHFTGDYYFSTCQLKNCTVYADSNCNSSSASDCPSISPGPCRLWCGGTDNTDDQICTSFNCTSSQQSCQPRCFYGKSHTCTITQSSCSGGFYAVKCGKSGTCTHSKCILDNCRNTQGTVVGDDVQLNSTSSGVVAANLTHPSDPARASGYGFQGQWKELTAPGAGAVFADGTNN